MVRIFHFRMQSLILSLGSSLACLSKVIPFRRDKDNCADHHWDKDNRDDYRISWAHGTLAHSRDLWAPLNTWWGKNDRQRDDNRPRVVLGWCLSGVATIIISERQAGEKF